MMIKQKETQSQISMLSCRQIWMGWGQGHWKGQCHWKGQGHWKKELKYKITHLKVRVRSWILIYVGIVLFNALWKDSSIPRISSTLTLRDLPTEGRVCWNGISTSLKFELRNCQLICANETLWTETISRKSVLWPVRGLKPTIYILQVSCFNLWAKRNGYQSLSRGKQI